MVTQKDVHNIIVENASPLQKSYISMQCGGNLQKIMEVEQTIAHLVNGVAAARKFDSFIFQKYLAGYIKPDFFMSNFLFYSIVLYSIL